MNNDVIFLKLSLRKHLILKDFLHFKINIILNINTIQPKYQPVFLDLYCSVAQGLVRRPLMEPISINWLVGKQSGPKNAKLKVNSNILLKK